ncbi:MAG: cache domain-containing protein [Opitutae bacterium]|nr:cache domain-containing protein [Opitutae bacterium]MBT5380054.1 cache domain-containing protein [Opitutae bacterium]MBT5690208.1 cache domain-containing protein [Opitutae bacterium]MBT6463439.1 cache domain-containing protein [Opitutae bacterium]MBT7853802.1 cache domain-containing protein [Opitutae bacterium]
MSDTQDIKFNIYNPVITYEHRAAFDLIVSHLQEIFPICNQGKCKALEVSDDPQKQKQINDLMEKVEFFSNSLITITKVFFDQLYRAKQTSSQSISQSTAMIKIDMIERNLLERTCDVRWWALEKAFWQCIILADENPEEVARISKTASRKATKSSSVNSELKNAVQLACTRLEDIRNSYTLYRDLVIVTLDGTVIANSNEERRSTVLGMNVSEEEWFKKALQTKDGTEYFVQDISRSKLEDVESLIYSTALRAGGDEQGEVIGAMGVLFDFQGESQIILNDYLPGDNDSATLDGWFSFFTNDQGRVICSSDEYFIPSGKAADIPRRHWKLDNPGDVLVSTAIVCGNRSLVVSHKSEGFDEYRGLGWTSHLVLPESAMFERSEENEDYGISPQELMNSRLIPDTNKQTYQEIQRNKGDIQLISINGIILATDLGKAGTSFIPIFDQITTTGNSTTGKMEELLSEMSSDMLQQNLKALENFSKQAIDLIDRNLFERAADVRWWSTDHAFWEALQNNKDENFEEASKRLGIINASYTMYRDLVIADSNGRIVANSKSENRDKLKRMNVSEQSWFRQGMQISRSVQFGVQDVCNSDLENEETSLIYCGGILEDGQREGKVLGVLGIFFDWENLAGPILEGCLPRIKNEVVEGGAAFYMNGEREIIASTDSDHFAIGQEVNIPIENLKLEDGESASGIFTDKGRKFIIGSSKTQGYREYTGLGWTAHVVRPID